VRDFRVRISRALTLEEDRALIAAGIHPHGVVFPVGFKVQEVRQSYLRVRAEDEADAREKVANVLHIDPGELTAAEYSSADESG
jgi:hypothetical protein